MDDSVRRIKGAERAKCNKLVAVVIVTVEDMKGKSDAELLTMSNELQGVSFPKLAEWRDYHCILVHAITTS